MDVLKLDKNANSSWEELYSAQEAKKSKMAETEKTYK